MEVLVESFSMAKNRNRPPYWEMGQRIISARETRTDLNQSEMTKALDLKEPTYGNYERGDRRMPPHVMTKFAEITGCSADWILLGRGSDDENSSRQHNHRALKATNSGLGELVPVYGHVSGGTDRIAINEGKIIEMRPRVAALEHVKDGYYLIVRGDSMAPALKNGHYLAVSPGHPPIKGEACAVCFKNGEAVVKIFMGMDDKNVIVEQLNPKKTLKYDRKEVETIAAGKGVVYYW